MSQRCARLHTHHSKMLPDIWLSPRSQYRYFVWLNSSVRGPFLPAYLRGKMHWTAAFTSRITDSVKLVGSTINCG